MERAPLAFYADAFIALCAILGFLAVLDQAWEFVYAWLGLGGLAQIFVGLRMADEVVPASGTRSPISSDIAHQVIVPVAAMSYAGFLEGVVGVVIAALVVLVSIYRVHFVPQASNSSAFQGLPLIWPSVGFLLSAFDATPLAAALVIGFVALLNLLPLPWPHPIRSTRWPMATRVVFVVAVLAGMVELWIGFRATPPILKSVFALIALYATAVMILNARDAAGTARAHEA